MKTPKLLIILALTLASYNIIGQSIEPSSEWRVNFFIGEPQIQTRYEFYRDYIEGDTIINSTSYIKIYKSGYGYIDYGPFPSYYYFSHYLHGFLREENNKWFTYDMSQNQDMLLFDFTLAVNDTVVSAFTYPSQGTILVTAVDSVLIDSVLKKRFHLNIPYGADYIIEDIGPNSGLFENMVFFEWESKLICYAENNVPVWLDSNEECNLNVNIPEEIVGLESCSVYPNPAEGYTILSVVPELLGFDILLVDWSGQIVFSQSSLKETSIKILLSAFPSGLYLLLVKNGNKHYKFKLLIK